VVRHRSAIFAHFGDAKQREFLDFVLDHYIQQGVGELDQEKLPDLLVLKYHAIADAVTELGSAPNIRAIFFGFQKHLYAQRAAA